MSSRRTATLFFGAVCLSIAAFVSSAFAANFQVGDEVEFRDFTEKCTGKIVRQISPTRFSVEYINRGSKRTKTVRPAEMVKLKPAAPAITERTWSGKNGKSKIVAVYLSQTSTHVSLRTTDDGSTKSIPIAMLCEPDRDYLAILQNPNDIPKQSPFYGGTEVISEGPAPFPDAYSESKPMKLSSSATWRYDPSANRTPVAPPSQASKSDIKWGERGSNEPTGFVLSQDGRTAAVSNSRVFDKKSIFYTVDVASGKETGKTAINFSRMFVCDVHNDGKHIALSGRHSSDAPVNELKVITTTGEEKFRWAFAKLSTSDRVRTAHFIGSKGLLITNDQGVVVLWNWEKKKAIYRIDSQAVFRPAFSPNRRTFAAVIRPSGPMDRFRHRQRGIENELYLIETGTGLVQGKLRLPKDTMPSSLAFSRDGTKLAASTPGKALIWDLENNGKLKEFELSNKTSASQLEWSGERYLLFGSHLIDLRLGAVVWQYPADLRNKDFSLANIGGDQFVLASLNSDKFSMYPLAIPEKELVEKTKNLNPDDMVHLNSGTTIRLVTHLDLLAPAERNTLIEALKTRFQAEGLNFGPDSDIVLEVAITKAEPHKTNWHPFVPGDERTSATDNSPGTPVEIVPHLHTLKIRKQDKLLFSLERGLNFNYETDFHLLRNETLSQAIERITKPNVAHFTVAQIPTNFSAAGDEAFKPGTTIITENGPLQQ